MHHLGQRAAVLALGALATFFFISGCGSEESVDCAGPGVYQRGKEGGPSCCPELNVYDRQVLHGQGTAELTCGDPVGHAEFGCIEGSCGDGTCEVGERGPCGCTLDCPAE